MAATFDVIVVGAGAAGLFYAGEAGARGARVLAIDHADKLGEKIRISGGGRCNFTNLDTSPKQFLSRNPKFCISALKGFGPRDFVERVDAAGIAWHAKAQGQLFCDGPAQQITDMLVASCQAGRVDVRTGVSVSSVVRCGESFRVETNAGLFAAGRLVVATGGKSIPKIGASGFGYRIAEQFGLAVVEPRPALVPLTFEGETKELARELTGVSVDASVSTPAGEGAAAKNRPPAFRDGFLFTHRGLSGPSILQISSYWREGRPLTVDLSPGLDVVSALRARRSAGGRIAFRTALADLLPSRLAQRLCDMHGWDGNLADWSDRRLHGVADAIHRWTATPSGSEGWRTAEVTIGGVDVDELDSRTMEAVRIPGLFFIGEVVDVTGWLGGYNFQWAWASAYAAAKVAI